MFDYDCWRHVYLHTELLWFFFFFVLLWKLKQGFLVTSLEGEKPSFPRNKKMKHFHQTKGHISALIKFREKKCV